jgi:hypothetical protein
MENQPASPIFIHSLFRSGSTYLFNVFRRSDSGYWCYQEPLNEKLIQRATETNGFLKSRQGVSEILRHPELNKPYFYEYHVVTDVIVKYFQEAFSYDQFFDSGKDDFVEITTYLTALRNGAQGRPVLQCCRSTGRVARLQAECGGVHIFLWRNPWDQWWSYKADRYFESRNLFISNAKYLPEFLQALKKELDIPDLRNANPSVKHAYCSNRFLDSTASYKLFYALWCHAMLEAKPSCKLSISIDQLSMSDTYRDEILKELELLGVGGLDFTNCSLPMASYGESDGTFFLKSEDRIHELLLLYGYSNEQVNELVQLSVERKLSLVDTTVPENIAIRDAMRAREYLQKTEARLAETQTMLFNTRAQVQQVEAKAHQTK